MFSYDKRYHYVISLLCYTFHTKDFKVGIRNWES